MAVTIVVVTLLGYKPTLHRWLRVIEEQELYAGIKLLVISVALLPFLPDQGYGPYNALNPYWIWWMVVLISGISFVGYFAIKLTDERKGTVLTAVTGGLASSTAVTFSLAQIARGRKKKLFYMGGVLIASSIMFIRVGIEVFIVNRALLQYLWIPLGLMFTGILIGGYWFLTRDSSDSKSDQQIDLDNPFQLGMALRFGLLLGLILLLSEAVKEWFGDEGIYLLSVASGLMDVDAITVSLSRMARNDLNSEVASLGIVLASATNTLIKGIIFAAIAGWKDSIRLILFLTAVVLPGILAGLYLII
jgi:uncharacterized membrane protein (DUF4010 family)